MRKRMAMMLTMAVLLCVAGCALAAGVTIKTFTPFADVDFAAQSYMDLITAWEAETGNAVEDYSGAMDEFWFAQLEEAVSSGAADVLVLPVGSGLTVRHLVSAGELMEATDIGFRMFDSMKEADGSVLLAPVRLNWEALYVNTDVLARYGLSVPETFEQLLTACAVLSQSGVTPIANALCERNEIVMDCAALAGGPQDQYGAQASLDGAKDYLTTLVQVDAFGSDPWNMSDMDAESLFLSGQAAMRIDAEGLTSMVDETRLDSVEVVPLPPKDGVARTAVVGTPMFGIALTRACWEDDARCEAAVSFAAKLMGEGGLVKPVGGRLGESIVKLTADAQDMTGLLYDMNPEGFDTWAESVLAHLMSL